MTELVSYGSVRGAVGNDRPYRESRDEFLPCLQISKMAHGAFSSLEGLAGIFGAIVEPLYSFLLMAVTDVVHGGTIGGQAVCLDGVWSTITLHGLL